MEAQNATELPRWKCHKEVNAFKIISISFAPESDGGNAVIGGSGLQVEVNAEYMKKHRPQIGGYYVVYEDGYRSFSPAPAFESGYARIPATGR